MYIFESTFQSDCGICLCMAELIFIETLFFNHESTGVVYAM